jgi:hypothetical protein
MSREWKPGDVAKIRVVAAITDPDCLGVRTPTGWTCFSDLADPHHHPDAVVVARPLVVIDPEDAEQIVALVDALAENGWTASRRNGARDALRGLIADPKPEEPLVRAALVEDLNGAIWARQCTRGHDTDMSRAWIQVANGRVAGPRERERDWRDIAAVRVLSEGVTA